MNLDWSRLKAVVIESDDWGLCAWSPDVEAWRALEGFPAFRTRSGRKYGGSTLESAADVRAISALLGEVRGGDGFPPVLQANTIMAAPDYDRLNGDAAPGELLPLVELPGLPSRWRRPGLWEEVAIARGSGVWWPELHGLHHLPETEYVAALRRGDADARAALAQQSPICAAVESSAEYDPREPEESRARRIERAVTRFGALFGRPPASLCPPDYRWDEALERDAERLGVTILQGSAEQAGGANSFRAAWRRAWRRARWGPARGKLFAMPPRIAFEPGEEGGATSRAGTDAAHRGVRAAWERGRPAVLSTHRANLVHLDAATSERGREALRDLLSRLVSDGAMFVVDREVRDLAARGWSAREIGERGVLLRCAAEPAEPVRLPLPAGASGARASEGHGAAARPAIEGREATLRLAPGSVLIEWERA